MTAPRYNESMQLPAPLVTRLVSGLLRTRRIRPVTAALVAPDGRHWAALVRDGRLYVATAARVLTVGDIASASEVPLADLPAVQGAALRLALAESARTATLRATPAAEA